MASPGPRLMHNSASPPHSAHGAASRFQSLKRENVINPGHSAVLAAVALGAPRSVVLREEGPSTHAPVPLVGAYDKCLQHY